jgi:LCP family protein required for cell wall assembly
MPYVKLSSWLVLPSLVISFIACQTLGQTRTFVTPQAATAADGRQNTPTNTPKPDTPRASVVGPARQTTSTDHVEPTDTAAIVNALPIPTSTEVLEPLPENTPPPTAEGLPTPPTAIPTAVATIEAPSDVINIVLAGNDVPWPQGGRTDALLVVSINRETKKAAILSLPRDLYVYIPGWTMNRINLALPHGHGVDYPGGGGGLLADTIEYNFGLSIDHYARIGFDGFKRIVDTLGGVEVVVNCPITDWRLKSPELDPLVEENWERFTLDPGVHQMDGDMALWYARSRRSTNDFDRGRRLQQIAHAILAKGVGLGLVDDVPDLWHAYRQNVETDLSLPELIELAAIAPAVNDHSLQHFMLPADAHKAWRVPTTGAAVQLIQWDAAEDTFEQLVSPPILNRGRRPPLTVEVVTDDTILFRQAAENLNWHGITAIHLYDEDKPPTENQITYNRSTLKGSFHWLVAWLFGKRPEDVALSPDNGLQYDYRIVLGQKYNPCLPNSPPSPDRID